MKILLFLIVSPLFAGRPLIITTYEHRVQVEACEVFDDKNGLPYIQRDVLKRKRPSQVVSGLLIGGKLQSTKTVNINSVIDAKAKLLPPVEHHPAAAIVYFVENNRVSCKDFPAGQVRTFNVSSDNGCDTGPHGICALSNITIAYLPQ